MTPCPPHHFLLAGTRPEAAGTCLKCGASRTFDGGWYEDYATAAEGWRAAQARRGSMAPQRPKPEPTAVWPLPRGTRRSRS